MESTPLLVREKKKSLFSRLKLFNFRKTEPSSREIFIGALPTEEFPKNYVCNQKYNIITFLPLVLYEQFRFFLNFYFLIMALSQFISSLRIGYLYTYWGPLCFVMSVTLIREAIDDFRRYRRDREVNRQKYDRMVLTSSDVEYKPFVTESVSASKLKVGDIVMLHKGQRVPADMILLRTHETMGAVYIRTDQLDGEIDWKLRIPLPSLQRLPSDAHLLDIKAKIFVEKPEKDIHSFIGTCTQLNDGVLESLDIENTLWSGSVVASGQATGLVIYTGSETRMVTNNAMPRSKVGRLDLQVNDLTKLLCAAVFLLSFLIIILKGFNGPWYAFLFRFFLLFSYIIPISLRVNLDIGKVYYSWTVQRDKKIEGTVMRSTTVPEELGRIQYLLADKTGTLTKNEMVFQRLHLENAAFDITNFHEVESLLTQHVTNDSVEPQSPLSSSVSGEMPPSPRQVWDVVTALALCHNVTPVYEVREDENDGDDSQSDMASSVMSESRCGAIPQQQLCDYQASSPDEVALIKWTDMMGVSLFQRDRHNISLKLRAANEILQFSILQMFPFKSESKMMGIIVQEQTSGDITYYVKGADVALNKLINSSWMDSESKRLAADGLRTLVVAKKSMTQVEYLEFENDYKEAILSKNDRGACTVAALAKLQRGLKLLGLTGVEDKLADDVPQTLGMLRMAGIKIWMLTGDKLETALCIARSLHLGGSGNWYVSPSCTSRRDAHELLEALNERNEQMDLIIEGETLELCLQSYEEEFVGVMQRCSGVVVARCSPTQKARVATLLRARKFVVAAVGDGGNDVAMIQEADMGIGIEGAEGRAASLAGDVSVRSFSSLARLLLVHGRRAAMRSAALSLFIIHRGLIVSTIQAVFSCVFYFSSVSLYPGFLMVLYGTAYTALPVFSLVRFLHTPSRPLDLAVWPEALVNRTGSKPVAGLNGPRCVTSLTDVLDKDLPSSTCLRYPQRYKQVTKGRELSYKTFFIWTIISIYQGGVIMYGALVLFEEQLIHIVEISFTALILTELIMIAFTVVTWHRLMVVAELLSLAMYIATLLIFTSYFDADFIKQWSFWWKVTIIFIVSCLPLCIVKCMHWKWLARLNKNMRRQPTA